MKDFGFTNLKAERSFEESLYLKKKNFQIFLICRPLIMMISSCAHYLIIILIIWVNKKKNLFKFPNFLQFLLYLQHQATSCNENSHVSIFKIQNKMLIWSLFSLVLDTILIALIILVLASNIFIHSVTLTEEHAFEIRWFHVKKTINT